MVRWLCQWILVLKKCYFSFWNICKSLNSSFFHYISTFVGLMCNWKIKFSFISETIKVWFKSNSIKNPLRTNELKVVINQMLWIELICDKWEWIFLNWKFISIAHKFSINAFSKPFSILHTPETSHTLKPWRWVWAIAHCKNIAWKMHGGTINLNFRGCFNSIRIDNELVQ